MQDLAEGRLDGEIPGIGRGDEIGAMAATVQIFKDNAVRIRGLEQAEAAGAGAHRGRATGGDGKYCQRFRTQRDQHRSLGIDGGGRRRPPRSP